jgi:hypothetical protein
MRRAVLVTCMGAKSDRHPDTRGQQDGGIGIAFEPKSFDLLRDGALNRAALGAATESEANDFASHACSSYYTS